MVPPPSETAPPFFDDSFLAELEGLAAGPRPSAPLGPFEDDLHVRFEGVLAHNGELLSEEGFAALLKDEVLDRTDVLLEHCQKEARMLATVAAGPHERSPEALAAAVAAFRQRGTLHLAAICHGPQLVAASVSPGLEAGEADLREQRCHSRLHGAWRAGWGVGAE